VEKMIIDINKLLNYSTDEVSFDKKITIDESYLKTTEIRHLSELNVVGRIKREVEEIISLEIFVEGEMILPCSVSLVDVPYPFNLTMYEVIDSEINGEYLKIEKNSIDILPLIWQNIVLEIPLKVLSPDLDRSSIKGEGWKLIDEDLN
jgi:uncharacterized protein